MVKLVDTLASGASGGNPVEVQVLSSAPTFIHDSESGPRVILVPLVTLEIRPTITAIVLLRLYAGNGHLGRYSNDAPTRHVLAFHGFLRKRSRLSASSVSVT